MRFPAVRPVVMEIICDIIGNERDHTREIVEAVIDAEQHYLFTNDLEYKQNRSSIVPAPEEQVEQQQQFYPNNPNAQQPQQQRRQAPTSTNVFVKEIRARIDTYFKIVLRNVRDTVPKQIGYFLVRMSQEKLQYELYQRINSNQNIIDQLGEPKSITERRKMLESIIKTLKDSLKILQRDPE